MSFNRLVLFLTLIAVFTMAFQPSVDTDSWWHLRSGEWILENGKILNQDTFSLTRQGQSWEYPGWLAQIALYSIFNEFSFAGLNFLTALMVLLAFAFLWFTLEGPGLLKSFVVLLAAAASGLYWSARPQIMTFALTGIFLYLLETNRKQTRWSLWLIPPLMALWVNVHGGFVVGFLLIAVYILCELAEIIISKVLSSVSILDGWQSRKVYVSRLLIVAILCIFTSVLNPHGPKMLLYPFETISIGTLREYIVEWQPPDFQSTEVQPYIFLLLLTFFALSITNQKRRVSDYVIVGVFGYMSMLAVRNVSLFALAAAPVLSRHLSAGLQPFLERFHSRKEVPKRWANFINVLLAGLISIAAFLQISLQLPDEMNLEHTQQQIPLKAFEFIKANQPPGNLFNSYNWGGYVLWDLYPRYFSFVDGRTDLFQDEILDEYLQTWLAEPGWQQTLARWEIRMVLIESGSPLAKAIVMDGWAAAYQDEQATIFLRVDDLP